MKTLEKVKILVLKERYKRFIAKLQNYNSSSHFSSEIRAYCPNPGLMSDLPIMGSRCLVAETAKNMRLVAIEAEPREFFVKDGSLRALIEEFLQANPTLEKLYEYEKRFREFSFTYEKYDEQFLEHINVNKRSPLWRNAEKMRKAILNRFVIENHEDRWVGVDTQISNELTKVHFSSLFPEEIFYPEKTIGNCRFDFVSSERIVEVKFCHWKVRDYVLFPDCITERGSRQLATLLSHPLKKNLIFIAQRDDVKYFGAGNRDKEYHDLFVSPEIRKNAFSYNLKLQESTLFYDFRKELELKQEDYATINS